MLDPQRVEHAAAIAQQLPYLRRYARALTGNQKTGDRYAAAVLETVIADPEVVTTSDDIRLDLFRIFHSIWSTSGSPVAEAEDSLSAAAQRRLAALRSSAREALLLNTIERFRADEVAEIMGISQAEARQQIEAGLREMEVQVRGTVLIIEDDALIMMDLSSIVTAMGHRVMGVARTHREAVARVAAEQPDLILADIKLADASSGIEAVQEILSRSGPIPVVFITAFPERLLTGETPEPAFLINKPYSEAQVRSAIGQAMFFSSTESLGT